jgi:3-dehydro-L-gulonate 2-dehydrogenase
VSANRAQPVYPGTKPSLLAVSCLLLPVLMRIPFDQLRETLERALNRLGIIDERAALSARLIAETDLDGISTHGIARFPRFAEMVRLGRIDPAATPQATSSLGAIERWSGNLGPGNLAAHAAMARAMELAEQHGIGGVALANTTHWQRGGTYGWQAANAGFAAICWSNTLPNLPPWGATTPALGNNPLVIAIPRASGSIVLDMAMSQFSYGTLAVYRERGEPLPVPGGFDAAGNLTTNAAAIEASQRALPIGFWKGSGLAFALDVLGAMLSGGQATHHFGPDPLREAGQSQVFLAISPGALAQTAIADDAIAFLHAAEPETPGHPARYPGERVLEARAENLRLGVPVNEAAWNIAQSLAADVKD